MRIVIGLGNIGRKYEHTRHNAGFLALDALKTAWDFESFTSKQKFLASISQGSYAGSPYLLVKPETFMNNSGESVRAILDFYKKTPPKILVLHDDKDLPIGTWRYTENSSSAGQKGIQNIIETLGTQAFRRIRIGIGPKPELYDTADFVLTPFQPEELRQLEEKIFPDIISAFASQKFFE